MRLHRDGTVRHGAGNESTDDLVPGLDLVDRDRSGALISELEETMEMDGASLIVSILGVSVESGLVLLPNGILEVGNTSGVVDVSLTTVTPMVLSGLGHTRWDDRLA